MRILFISNHYPPAHSGGYAQLCQEVAQQLRGRGHTLGVLTSNYNSRQAPANEAYVYRDFYLDGDLLYYRPIDLFLHWKRQQRENRATVTRTVADFRPDVIVVWGMRNLSKEVPAYAEQLLPSRVVYYLADYWPVSDDMHTIYWRTPARRWYMNLAKRMLAVLARRVYASEPPAPLSFDHALCVSAALRNNLVGQGAPLERARVVYNGIDPDEFNVTRSPDAQPGQPMNLLYAGQLVEHKGVHTALDAMEILFRNGHANELRFTILGSGHPAYETRLRAHVDQAGLHDIVTFRAPVPREMMPHILVEFDVLLFPSIYEEPLARMVQEAMASGLVVIGTTTGGTEEILRNEKNGLTFNAGNSTQLADQIARLLDTRGLYNRLVHAGRRTVLQKFTIQRMVDEIEAYLDDVCNLAPYDPGLNNDYELASRTTHANIVSH